MDSFRITGESKNVIISIPALDRERQKQIINRLKREIFDGEQNLSVEPCSYQEFLTKAHTFRIPEELEEKGPQLKVDNAKLLFRPVLEDDEKYSEMLELENTLDLFLSGDDEIDSIDDEDLALFALSECICFDYVLEHTLYSAALKKLQNIPLKYNCKAFLVDCSVIAHEMLDDKDKYLLQAIAEAVIETATALFFDTLEDFQHDFNSNLIDSENLYLVFN